MPSTKRMHTCWMCQYNIVDISSLTGGEAAPAGVPPPVGRLSIELRERASQSGSLRSADVAVIIKTDAAPVRLNGIVVKEPRPGWVTLDVPPLEAWEKPLRWLLPHQRERVVTPEFFHLLQEHVTRRFLGKRPAA